MTASSANQQGTVSPGTEPELRWYDILLVNSSAGKDSQATLDVVVEAARAAGVLDRVVVVHADLGEAEWEGVPELAAEHAAHYGLRFELARREVDGQTYTILDHVQRRGKWPSAQVRFVSALGVSRIACVRFSPFGGFAQATTAVCRRLGSPGRRSVGVRRVRLRLTGTDERWGKRSMVCQMHDLYSLSTYSHGQKSLLGDIWAPHETYGDQMIEMLHAEVLPLVDRLQEAGARGVSNLARLPYQGLQWRHRAYQRDPFVVAFTNVLPKSFGTFFRREELIAHRRLVFHSDPLNLDLVLRRRGSLGAYRSSGPRADVEHGVQEALFPIRGQAATPDAPRLAALIWDTPELNKKRKAVSPTPIAVRLAAKGHTLDDNEWEAGFTLPPVVGAEDLIPGTVEYQHDMPDWDIEAESDAQ